jgi:hypothetical protein
VVLIPKGTTRHFRLSIKFGKKGQLKAQQANADEPKAKEAPKPERLACIGDGSSFKGR